MVGTFWHKGYAGASLDDLVAATGLKRASLYGAFGNKQAMYLAALEAFARQMRAGLLACFPEGQPIEAGLRAFLGQAIEIYRSGAENLGCMIFCTAPAEAVEDPQVAGFLAALTMEMDAALAGLITRGVASGEFRSDADTAASGQMVIALLQSLALRARSGAEREALEGFVEGGVKLLLSSLSPQRPS